jgi:maltooligosyltrehalose trehalohydrolase
MVQEEVPDPQSEDVFNRSKLDEDFSGNRKNLFEYYKKLINLKKNHPVWNSYDRSNTNAVTTNKKLILINKRIDNNQLIAILNYNSSEKDVTLPESGGKELFFLVDSAAIKWGGDQKDQVVTSGKVIKVMPSSMVVLSDIPVNE